MADSSGNLSTTQLKSFKKDANTSLKAMINLMSRVEEASNIIANNTFTADDQVLHNNWQSAEDIAEEAKKQLRASKLKLSGYIKDYIKEIEALEADTIAKSSKDTSAFAGIDLKAATADLNAVEDSEDEG